MRILRVATLACLLTLPTVRAAASPELAARELLERAFENRYGVDFTADVELVMSDASGRERRRSFRALSKRIEDLTHSIGRLTAPSYLRGLAVLTIETPGRGHDAFVYLPSLAKVRRITTAKRRDAFLGSDLTYEDLERRRISEFEVIGTREIRFPEPAIAISTARTEGGVAAQTEFHIARSDAAILETRHFARSGAPRRIVTHPRASMVERSGHVLPTHIVVRHLGRDTRTEVAFRNLEVNAPIDSRWFSVATLDRGRALPGETP